MSTIVQSAGYVYPDTNAPSYAIALASAPTPGNLLVAAVPVDLVQDGATINPFWTLFLNQEQLNPSFPVNWFARVVQAGDPADLPEFYDGLTFGQLVGGALWEVQGATLAGLSASYGVGGANVESPTTPIAALTLPSFQTPAPGALALAFVNAKVTQEVSSIPPWCEIAVGNGYVQDGYAADDPPDNPGPSSYWFGHQAFGVVADAGYSASFPNIDAAIALASAIALPASRPPGLLSQFVSTQLPCIPCLKLPCGRNI
jgi:hypothetical protein